MPEIEHILSSDTVPQDVTNRMLLAGIRSTYQAVRDLSDSIRSHDERIAKLEQIASAQQQREERFVAWPWLLERFGQPIAIAVIMYFLLTWVPQVSALLVGTP
jgi:hypothetical protein